MEPLIEGGGRMAPQRGRIETTVALEGDSLCIAEARHLAADFLSRAQAEHGLPVTDRTIALTQLVVSELVTNALKYAPGPVLVDLRIAEGTLEVAVWDSDPVLPVARTADPGRVGQHGLEIVMAICESFEARREPVGKHITARIALLSDPDLDTF
ncbi:ATP-binding protein [Streptomyces sp. CWNU-52B]|uniref:ATP-binding protein n=1 Tax=unclassified Streptomyces TaxID=2593676 RepID=UPI0039BF912F